jgi:hypothetical protein
MKIILIKNAERVHPRLTDDFITSVYDACRPQLRNQDLLEIANLSPLSSSADLRDSVHDLYPVFAVVFSRRFDPASLLLGCGRNSDSVELLCSFIAAGQDMGIISHCACQLAKPLLWSRRCMAESEPVASE